MQLYWQVGEDEEVGMGNNMGGFRMVLCRGLLCWSDAIRGDYEAALVRGSVLHEVVLPA